MKLPTPVIAVEAGYKVPRSQAPVDLRLDANEGQAPDPKWLQDIQPESVRRYPNRAEFTQALSAYLGLEFDQILVSSGGDDVIDRALRLFLDADRNLVVLHPSFVMFERYAELTRAEVRRVDWWEGAFPREAVESAIDVNTGVVALVSPNNPTGLTIDASTILSVAGRHPDTLVLADLAYIEFADHDPTHELLAQPNILVVRTLSKAFGLAGLRVGYGLGNPEVIRWLGATGGPYPVSAASLQIATKAVLEGQPTYPKQAIAERERLTQIFESNGCVCPQSQGNFVFPRVEDGPRFRDAMSGLGIGVRAWESGDLQPYSRIACPGDSTAMTRLEHAIQTVLKPQALVFDLDGVIADVRQSYRAAIVGTARHFGVATDEQEIAKIKAAGDANNDWVVTQRILGNHGKAVSLDDVKTRFEGLYQGEPESHGLWNHETIMVDRGWFERLSEAGWKLGIVTGRPRRDAERFLGQFGLEGVFGALVCMEDAPLKPDPAPVRLALQQLDVERAWMFGDTPDDLRAARAAGVVPVGVVAPGEDSRASLFGAGAGFVLDRLDEFVWSPFGSKSDA